MKINMAQIYAQLKAWRAERGTTTKNQKEGYLRNVMEELGQLAAGLREYDSWSECDLRFCQIHKEMAERVIVDTICNIAVLTINAEADIPCHLKYTEMEWEKYSLNADYILKQMVEKCAEFSYFEWDETKCFNIILANCAYLCEQYGFNFEIAMLEHIKQISSNTDKEYKANYEKARIVNVKDKK